MTTASVAERFRAIALDDLQVSTTGSQAERRAHFDKAALSELSASLKERGQEVPIIARPVNGHFEIIAGERRFLAAQTAGLTEMIVDVRHASDDDVLDIQLIENLQREGLHELAEAEGYEELVKRGHAAEEIADKVGKSKGYIYSRLKLCTLSKASRAAFYDKKLTASTALLLARIPTESLQVEALKDITNKKWGEPVMSFREAADHIREHYMTNLSAAGFPTEDLTLIAAAGACGACPKRTGNQAELFGDVKSGNVCTDPVCFRAKREAHTVREIAKAAEDGRTVITGKKAKEIFPYSGSSARGGFVSLEDRSYQDPKNRTAAQLLGKNYTPILVKHPETGELIKVVPESAVKAALKEAGVKPAPTSNPQSAAEKKAKIERKFRVALYSEMRDKFPDKLGSEDLRTLALRFFQEMQHESRKQLLGLWAWEIVKTKGYSDEVRAAAEKGLKTLDDAQLARFLFDLIFIRDLQVGTYSVDKAPLLLATAKKLKINVEQIRRRLNAASIPKATKKKSKAKKS